MKWLIAFCTLVPAIVIADEIADLYPVAENVRGHENTEWSTSYAYHLTDANKDLPRVLLVGDSICQGYQSKVREKLEGKANVTYWASSYCVTSANYLKFLGIYLDEAPYDVVHFNNGLHSTDSNVTDYTNMLSAAFALIKAKQPDAKIVWATSTPINTANETWAGKVVTLNTAAADAVADAGGISTNDLYALMNPLDRGTYWVDTHHYTSAGYELLASQIVEKVTAAMAPEIHNDPAADPACVLYYDFETTNSLGRVVNKANPGTMDGVFVAAEVGELGVLPKLDSATPAARILQSSTDENGAASAYSLYNNYSSSRATGKYLYCDLASGLSLVNTDFTVEMFYKTDGSVENWTPLFRDSSSARQIMIGVGDNVNGTGNSFCGKIKQSDNTVVTVTDTSKTNDGEWHHIALVREGRTVTLYRDSSQVASTILSGDSLTAEGTRWWFGGGGGGANTYNGWIDSVRVTLRALSPSEFLVKSDPSRGLVILFAEK